MFWWFCLLQAFGGTDQVGRGARHKAGKGKWMAGSSKEEEEKGSKPQKKWRPAGSVGIAHDSQSWGQEFEPQARGRGYFKKCTREGTHTHRRDSSWRAGGTPPLQRPQGR